MAEKIPDKEKLDDLYVKLRKKFVNAQPEKDAPDDGNVFRRFLGYMAIFPDFVHLLIKLLFDKEVPAENKGALIAAAAYLVSPIDIIPDAVPVYGFVDDFIVLIVALNKFFDTDNPKVRAAIEKHWAGDRDVFETVKHLIEVIDNAAEFLPKKLMKIIKDAFPTAARPKK